MNIEQENSGDFLPPPNKRAWLYVLGAIAFIGITTLVLRTAYRHKIFEEKKKTFGLIKRTTPARYSNYTLVFSKTEPHIAQQIADDVSAEIGADSAITEMVVAGTAIYQHTASLAEYRHLIRTALAKAGAADVYKQSLLFGQLVGVMQMDTLPVRLHLAGSISSHENDTLPHRFFASVRDLSARAQKIGRVQVVSYLRPDTSQDVEVFLRQFEERNIPLQKK